MGIIKNFISGSKFAYEYATVPHVRFEAKRRWRRNYREWKMFDANRQLSKIGAVSFSFLVVYLIITNRLVRIFFRLPSEDPNYLMKSSIFIEEQNALMKRRDEAEQQLIDSSGIRNRSKPAVPVNPFGDDVRPTSGSPMYSSGEGEIPSPTSFTGVK